jgi:transcriptional regulator with XRE-family HTH domain
MDLDLLGRRIAELRASSGLSASDLAKQVELSRGYLSRMENGHQIPSLATLDSMATVLGVRLADFFSTGDASATEDVAISRNRNLVGPSAGFSYEPLTPGGRQGFLPFLAVFAPGSETRIGAHTSGYFRYVIEGSIGFSYGDQDFQFDAGDAFSYLADREHIVRCSPTELARVLTVVQRVDE